MTVNEAAARLGLGNKRVYQLIKKTFPHKRKVFGVFSLTEEEVHELGRQSRGWVVRHCMSSELARGRIVEQTGEVG